MLGVLGGKHRDCIWYKESMVKIRIFFFLAVDSKSLEKKKEYKIYRVWDLF